MAIAIGPISFANLLVVSSSRHRRTSPATKSKTKRQTKKGGEKFAIKLDKKLLINANLKGELSAAESFSCISSTLAHTLLDLRPVPLHKFSSREAQHFCCCRKHKTSAWGNQLQVCESGCALENVWLGWLTLRRERRSCIFHAVVSFTWSAAGLGVPNKIKIHKFFCVFCRDCSFGRELRTRARIVGSTKRR